MAKKKTYKLTDDELAAITQSLKGTKNNTLEGYEAAVEAALRQKYQDDLKAQWKEKVYPQLADIVNYSSGTRVDGNLSPSEIAYGEALTDAVREMLDAGIDPYSDPEIRAAVAEATKRGWALPYNSGVDWDRFTQNVQDENYMKAVQDAYGGFNLGFDPNNLPTGVDAETAARNSLAGVLGEGGTSSEQNQQYVYGEVPTMRAQLAQMQNMEPRMRYADLVYGTTPRRGNTPNGGVAAGDIARNGTTGWMSDEYPDITTVADGNGIAWDNDPRSRLAEAMGVNGYGQNIGAVPTDGNLRTVPASQAFYSPSAGTGYAAQNTAPDRTEMYFRDYMAKKNPASGAGGGTGSGSKTTRTSFPRTNSVQAQGDVYNSMIDALVRGSNGGMPTSNGLTLANAVYDNSRRVGITDPKPVYSQYAATAGNPLARDKDYNYLNRLLNIKR